MADLQRFHKAHEKDYSTALAEIKSGRKKTHWMWYIFPQIKGLGYSEISKYYAIEDIEEAKAYIDDPVLGAHMIEICQALLALKSNDANQIFGFPDNVKLQSSMTLFSITDSHNDVYKKVLAKYFDGLKDQKTIRLLGGK